MSNETEKERGRKRTNERSKRELNYELARDLKRAEDNRKQEEIKYRHRSKKAEMAIIFISTLVICYLLFFILRRVFYFFAGSALGMLGVSVDFIYPFFHAAIWIIAILSAYRRRSLLDDWVQRFL